MWEPCVYCQKPSWQTDISVIVNRLNHVIYFTFIEHEIMSDITSVSVQTSSESSTRTFPFHCYIACWCTHKKRMFSAIVHSSSNDTTVMQWVIYLMESPFSLISYEPFKGLFSIPMSGTQVQYTWTKTGWVWLWEMSASDN